MNALLETNTLVQLKKYLEEGNDFTNYVKDSFPQGMVENIKEQILATDFEEKKDFLAAYKSQMLQKN